MDAKATFEDKAMCLTEIIAVAAGGAGLAAFYKALETQYLTDRSFENALEFTLCAHCTGWLCEALEKPLPPLPASASGSPLFKGLRDFYTGKIVVTSGYGILTRKCIQAGKRHLARAVLADAEAIS